VDECIEHEEKQPVKTNIDELVSISEEHVESSTEEDDEEPSNPHAKDPSRYVQKHHPTDHIVGELNTSV